MQKMYIQELLHYAAKQYAERIAIEYRNRHILYTELENRSNNLANFLLSSGIPRGSIVAIVAEDRVETIIATIGILKAGCAYVYCDPNLPEQRLGMMLTDLSPQWFVLEASYLQLLDQLLESFSTHAHAIVLDEGIVTTPLSSRSLLLYPFAHFWNSDYPNITYGPNDLSYIYFTSGSTGKPKGIAGRLKAIAHFITWEIKLLEVTEETRISQLTTPSFDAFMRDIFVPLCAGGTLCIPPAGTTMMNARELVHFLDQKRVHIIHCVPSLFRTLLNERLQPDQFSALRFIMLAGEPLLPSDLQRWMSIYGQRVQLINLYGPSETTMTKFFYFVQPSDQYQQRISIGKPMEGARALLLNDEGKVCSSREVGEIYIRTPYRALGYYNQPELTAQVFLQNPFSDRPDDIVYKTGDLGRILDDGIFELLGRKDRQVKIRGVRVEIGEIENALRLHEAVKDVAIVDQVDASGTRVLYAYLVLRRLIEVHDLRNFLGRSLPDSMIPLHFIELAELPQTISGKVDFRRLQEQQVSGTALPGKEYVAPSTVTEHSLVRIWSDILQRSPIGVWENFFEIGGHSLLVTQVASRVREELLVDLPLRSFFETSTIAALALLIEEQAGSQMTAQGAEQLPLRATPHGGMLPLSFAQQRLWFLDQLAAGHPFYNIRKALFLRGNLHIAALDQSLHRIVERHEAIRTTFTTSNGQPVQWITPLAALPKTLLLYIDISQCNQNEREQQKQRLIQEEAQRPFDLSQDLLLRTMLLRLAPDEHILLLIMHHIASDGWSMGILQSEMSKLYNAFATERSDPLASPPIQYADFAIWQRQRLQGPGLEIQLNYWKSVLADLPVLELPTDHLRPSVETFQGARYFFKLPAELLKRVKRLCQQEEVTLFMALLGAFKILLMLYSSQEDIVVGIPIANRTQAELETIIGFFVNTLVLRTQLGGDPSVHELLQRVRGVTLNAYAYQDVPFELLVEELQPERNLSRNPLCQVLFQLQHSTQQGLELTGLSIQPLEIHNATTKFDFVFSLLETTQGLSGIMEYSTDLFEEATIERMMQHYRTTLEEMVSAPNQLLSEISLTSEEELSQLESWSGT